MLPRALYQKTTRPLSGVNGSARATMSKRAASSDNYNRAHAKRSKISASPITTPDAESRELPKKILVIGLAGHAPGSKPIQQTLKQPRGQFRGKLKATASQAKEAGLDLEIMQVKPSAFSTFLKEIRPKLEAKPDGMVIGYGIRGTADYTEFFEDLVNLCCETTPTTRMAFNTSPDDILECCLRNFS